MAVDLYVQDDNNITLDVPTNDLDLLVGQPVVTRIENDYEELRNLPQINHVTLIGDKSFDDLGLDLSRYVPWDDVDTELDSESNNPISNSAVVSGLSTKQDSLTFDTTPTEGSSNPVTSDGIYDALEDSKNIFLVTYGVTPFADIRAAYVAGKAVMMNYHNTTFFGSLFLLSFVFNGWYSNQNNAEKVEVITVSINNTWTTATYELQEKSDMVTEISASSTNKQYPSAKAVFDALEDKQNTLTFDTLPEQDSTNPVTSGGIYDAIEYAKQEVRQDIADVRADIPTKTSELENDGYDGTSTYVEADQLATVATSGAYSDLTGQPTDLSDFNNDVGFVNATEAANAAPVQSVNGQTGTVTLDASDVGALPDTTSIPTKTSDLQNDGADGTSTYVETDELPEVHNIPAGGNAGQILKKISATDYDVHWADQTQYYPSGYSTTGADKQTKQIACSSWTATAKSYLHILLTHANTYAGKLYFSVNAVNTYEVWINGAVSSATNYSLPAGTYIIYFDGSAFQVRTDGIIPASVNGTAARIPYGECDSTSTSTAFTATVPGITELKDGVTMLLYNGVVTSASGFTININGLGAKPSYNNMTMGNPVTPTSPTRDTTIFNINYAFLFVYSETLVSGGCWIGYRGYDANTNTIGYQLRTNNSTMKASDKFYRYRLLFTSADGSKWVPANTSTSTNATSARTPNPRAIDPFGEICWYGTTTAIEANANVTAGQIWQEYYGSYTNIGYSFNNTGAAQTMTANQPIYIKCTPQADGSAIIDATTPYTQTLPTTDDGKIYIYLGRAYNATNFEITMNHPVYYYKNGGIRFWTGMNIPTKVSELTNDSGFITLNDLPVWNGGVV